MSIGAGTSHQGTTSGSNQASFKSSPYDDSTWEVVGEPPRPEEFYPMQVPQLKSDASMMDPMFADFGGGTQASEATDRWHLPQHLSHEGRAASRKPEEDPNLVKILPEDLERLRQEAFEAGRLQGTEDSVGSQHARMELIESSIRTMLEDLRVQMEEMATHIARKGSDLAVAIAKKVIDGAVEINPEYIVKTIEEALRLAGSATIRKIKISRQDMEFIEVVGVSKMLKDFDGSWTFEADDSIRAGCVIETSAGEVDYDLDRAWERIRDDVIKVVR